jgi:hypothetical protein
MYIRAMTVTYANNKYTATMAGETSTASGDIVSITISNDGTLTATTLATTTGAPNVNHILLSIDSTAKTQAGITGNATVSLGLGLGPLASSSLLTADKQGHLEKYVCPIIYVGGNPKFDLMMSLAATVPSSSSS